MTTKTTEPTPEAPLNEILEKYVTNTDTGLVISDGLPFEDWHRTYDFYISVYKNSPWRLGDLLRYGSHKYGEKYAQAVDIGKSTSYLATMVSVCERFSDISRRRPELGFDLHVCVAYIPPLAADQLLEKAIRKGWDRDELRDAVAKYKGLPTKAEKEAKKKELEDAKVKVTTTTGTDGKQVIDGAVQVTKTETPQETVAAPQTPAVTSQPVSAPKPAEAVLTPENQAVLLERAESNLNIFVESTRLIQWDSIKPLQVLKWIEMMIPCDELIDLLVKRNNSKRT